MHTPEDRVTDGKSNKTTKMKMTDPWKTADEIIISSRQGKDSDNPLFDQ
jgi:hypothetical protein